MIAGRYEQRRAAHCRLPRHQSERQGARRSWTRTVPAARRRASSIPPRSCIYLGEKTGKFIGAPEDRPELLSWLMFIASGLGPFSGQAVHFQFAAPEGLDYAVNRYRREAERHYKVLDDHLEGRDVHCRRQLHHRRHLGLGMARPRRARDEGSGRSARGISGSQALFADGRRAARGRARRGGREGSRLQDRGRRRDPARALPLELSRRPPESMAPDILEARTA